MKKSNVEKILWKAIKDIESGNVEYSKIDVFNGYLKGRNKFLSKINISNQSAKYTDNNNPISRPTIDKYKNIIKYIEEAKNNNINKNQDILNENLKFKKDNILLKNKIKELEKLNNKLAEIKYLKSIN
jgi:hypothetical protein